jgi:hypothetical protein
VFLVGVAGKTARVGGLGPGFVGRLDVIGIARLGVLLGAAVATGARRARIGLIVGEGLAVARGEKRRGLLVVAVGARGDRRRADGGRGCGKAGERANGQGDREDRCLHGGSLSADV